MGLTRVGKLPEAQVIEQIVGQPDLVPGALELTKILEAEKNLHRHTAESALLFRRFGWDGGCNRIVEGHTPLGTTARTKPIQMLVRSSGKRHQVGTRRLARLRA